MGNKEKKKSGKKGKHIFLFILLAVLFCIVLCIVLAFIPKQVPSNHGFLSDEEQLMLESVINRFSDSMVTEDGYVQETAELELSPDEVAVILHAVAQAVESAGVVPEYIRYFITWENGSLFLCADIPWQKGSLFHSYVQMRLVPGYFNEKVDVKCSCVQIGALPLSSFLFEQTINCVLNKLIERPEVKEMMRIFVSVGVSENNVFRVEFHPQDIGKFTQYLLSGQEKQK